MRNDELDQDMQYALAVAQWQTWDTGVQHWVTDPRDHQPREGKLYIAIRMPTPYEAAVYKKRYDEAGDQQARLLHKYVGPHIGKGTKATPEQRREISFWSVETEKWHQRLEPFHHVTMWAEVKDAVPLRRRNFLRTILDFMHRANEDCTLLPTAYERLPETELRQYDRSVSLETVDKRGRARSARGRKP